MRFMPFAYVGAGGKCQGSGRPIMTPISRQEGVLPRHLVGHWREQTEEASGGDVARSYVATAPRRIQIAALAKSAEGIQTQTSSLIKTRAPHSLKNARTLIGETWIGVNGKK